jgi:holin-like protein
LNIRRKIFSATLFNTMKYINQFAIILAISLVGELLNRIIPLPIPASIYGMVILFTALCTGGIKLPAVKETAHFLVQMLPMMFIPATVGLLEKWNEMQSFLTAIIVISLVSTIVVIFVSGRTTQHIINHRQRRKKQ